MQSGFFILVKVSSVFRALLLFDINLVAKKNQVKVQVLKILTVWTLRKFNQVPHLK